MMSNKHLSLESLYLYAVHVFGNENWLHEIKNQTISEKCFIKCVIILSF